MNVRTENRHGRSDPLYLLVQTTSEPIKLLAETKVGQLNIYNIYNYLHKYLHKLSTHICIQVKETEQTETLSSLVAVMVGVAVSLVSILVMVVIAVLTTRSRARYGGGCKYFSTSEIYFPPTNRGRQQLSRSGSECSAGRSEGGGGGGYCTTISSDVAVSAISYIHMSSS